MHIAIDISSLPYGTGVSVYAKELVLALKNLNTNHRFTLVAGALKNAEVIRGWFKSNNFPNNFNLKTIPIAPKFQNLLWTNLNLFPIENWIENVDLVHSLDWSLGIGKKPTLITVHDLFFLLAPDIQKHPYQKVLKKRISKAKQANLSVIAVSKTTKNDLINLFDYPDNRIQVIYEACPSNWGKLSQETQAKFITKYHLNFPYLIAVSTLEPRKNLQRLIEAFLHLKTNHKLVIVGKIGWGDIYIPSSDKIIKLGYVPDSDLEHIWQNSNGYLYPSLYEGFGLPILQSYKLGVPVLTSNISATCEIAKDGAILVDPYSIESIAKGIKTLISMDQNQLGVLVSKGRNINSQFSWEKTAKQTLTLYESYF